MFKKFASVRILGWKSLDHKKTAKTNYGEKYKSYYLDGSPSLNVKAALDDVGDIYNISKDPKDYELIVVRAVEADEPNANGDAFPNEELLRFDPEQGQKIYRTFNLKPHHVNHQSDNPKMARGVILDSHYNEMNDGKAFVEILVASDKSKDPILIKNIISGKLDKFSMGCHCDYTECSICDHKAYNEMQFCEHIANHKMAKIAGKLAYEKCYGVIYDEISSVYDPAMEGCEAIDILSAEKDVETMIAEQTEELIRQGHLANKEDGVIVVGGLKPNHTITITNNNREEVKKNMPKNKKGDKLQKKADDDLMFDLEKEEEEIPEAEIPEVEIPIEAPVETPEEEIKIETQDEEVPVEEEVPPVEEEIVETQEEVPLEEEIPEEEVPISENDLVDEDDEMMEAAIAENPEDDLEKDSALEAPRWIKHPEIWDECIARLEAKMGNPGYGAAVAYYKNKCNKMGLVAGEDEEIPIEIPTETPEIPEIPETPEIPEVPEELEKETQSEEEKEVEEENADEDEIVDNDIDNITDDDDVELSGSEFGMQSGLLDLEAERVNDTNWIIADSKGPLYLVKLNKTFPTMHASFAERFASKDYGIDLLRAILKNGFIKTMTRVNAINVVSDLAIPENIDHPEIWLEIVGEVDDAPLVPKKIQAEYDKRMKIVKKADPATVETKETKVDMDVRPANEFPVKDDVQPLISPATVKTDVTKALDELPPTDTHHAYKDVAVEFDKKVGWKVFNGETCLFTVSSKNATRKVGIKLLKRIAEKGMHDTWKKFGEDLPEGITEDVMNDLDENAKNYKVKDDIQKVISPAEMKKDKNQSLDELPPTTDSVVKIESIKNEAKRSALKEAEELIETEKQAYRTKLRRGIKLAAKRANFNVEENSLKAALWDALTKYAELDSDTTEIAIETAFEDAGSDYINNVITRGEELAEYSTPAFAQLEEDMNKIKPIAVNDEDEEKEEDEDEVEANKIAKQAESGSLGLRRTEKEGKGGKTIKSAVMSYNVRK